MNYCHWSKSSNYIVYWWYG